MEEHTPPQPPAAAPAPQRFAGTLNRDLFGKFSTWDKGTRVTTATDPRRSSAALTIHRETPTGHTIMDMMGNVPPDAITPDP